ncbi:hypothetical protein QQF64_025708 [Cirrhinus molitorella]|uniref:Ig-like domain-containing protein n=1 Tax=Cirrhinus molitorella TaxID=172907 RepID=A0ABR3NQ87_9TELE
MINDNVVEGGVMNSSEHIIVQSKHLCPPAMKFICLTLLIICGITDSRAEQFEVVGPVDAVLAVVGEDVILPCSVKPNISVVDMRVEWFRPDLKDSQLVHLYRDHEDRNIDQSPSYRRRTKLNHQELQKGNASLKLSSVQVSDEGLYRCFIQSKSWYDDVTVNVRVEAVGLPPVITIDGFDHSGGLQLQCESEGNMFNSWRTSVIMISVFAVLSVIVGILVAVFAHKNKEQSQLQNEHSKLQNKHHKLQNEQSQLQNEHSKLQNEHHKLQNEQSQLQNEHSKLQNEHHKLQNEQSQLQNEHSKLQNEHHKLQNEHHKLQNEQSQLQNEHSKLQNEHHKLQNEQSQLQNEHSKLQNEQSQLQNEQSQLQNEHRQLQNEHSQLRNEYSQLRNEHSIQNEHSQLQNEHRKLLNEKRGIHQEHEELLECLKTLIPKALMYLRRHKVFSIEYDHLLEHLKTIIPKAITHLRTHRVNVILDADTAYPHLIVSDGGKQTKSEH